MPEGHCGKPATPHVSTHTAMPDGTEPAALLRRMKIYVWTRELHFRPYSAM